MANRYTRLIGATLAGTVAFAIANGAHAQNTPDIVWKFGHENRETVPAAKAAHILAEEVAKRTDGHFKIEIYPAGQLGKEAQLVEQLQLGTVQMTFTPTAPLSNFEPRMQLLDLPFLFPSHAAAYAVLDGPVGEELLGGLQKRGLKGLGFWESGFKQMTSAVRPILSPADLGGQKVRTMQSPMLLEQYRSWGANPVAISFSETYNALQQGIAEAQENPLVSIDSMRFYEVQKYLTLTNHGYTAFVVMANRKAYDGLTPEYRKALTEAFVIAKDAERKDSQQLDAELLNKLSGRLEVHKLSAEGRAEFVRLSRELHKKYEEKVTKALLEQVYEETKRFEQ